MIKKQALARLALTQAILSRRQAQLLHTCGTRSQGAVNNPLAQTGVHLTHRAEMQGGCSHRDEIRAEVCNRAYAKGLPGWEDSLTCHTAKARP